MRVTHESRDDPSRGKEIRRSLRQHFRSDSRFSADDLAHLMHDCGGPEVWLADLLDQAHWYWKHGDTRNAEQAFTFSRIMHTTASALEQHLTEGGEAGAAWLGGLRSGLPPIQIEWLAQLGLAIDSTCRLNSWVTRAKAVAFEHLRRGILGGREDDHDFPVNALRSDEIIWGRAPARLDLAGGWTDTPPYSLERGGCVLNAAVELNRQPPIQVYARVATEPVVRLRSIDVGTDQVVRDWTELLDYGPATGEFSLLKAALVISGFAPRSHGALRGATLQETLQRFGGGIELTTLAAIPKGSGLGTSSIMGAALLAVIHRLIGRPLSPTQLFHAVLRLEQALTTGGGWQDQIGGSVGGLKLIVTQPGLVPEATMRYVPDDVLNPAINGGRTLLYYTGITRLAKNILEHVVSRYLNRDREAMATLNDIRNLAPQMADVVARKDLALFGRLMDVAWQLNKKLDAGATNDQIEELVSRSRPFIHGAKLAGAGGGGFLLLVCKSADDAARLREQLQSDPPNQRARFFDFRVTPNGLDVSVC